MTPDDGRPMVTPSLVDLETALAGTPPGHKADLRLWLRMLSCVNLIEAEIRRRLREQFATTLPRFDLLAQLDRDAGRADPGRNFAPDDGVQRQCHRPRRQSGRRRPGRAPRQPADRRVQRLCLTPHGRRAFERQSAAHESWIADLFAVIPSTDRATLHRLLGVVKTGVRQALTEESP